jgi:hypothetical protein
VDVDGRRGGGQDESSADGENGGDVAEDSVHERAARSWRMGLAAAEDRRTARKLQSRGPKALIFSGAAAG